MSQRGMIRVAAAFAASGRYSMIWIAAAVGGVVFAQDTSQFGWFLVAIVAEWVLTNAPVKLLFKRDRPDNSHIAELIPDWLHPPRSSSFPSGHSSAAAFSTVIWFAFSPVTGIISLMFGLAMGISRAVIKAHHPTDVIAGFAWGALLAAAALVLFGDHLPA